MSKLQIIAIAVLTVACAPAKGTTVFFEFILPEWDIASANFGDYPVIQVGVDNGSSSLISQTYLNSDIQSVSVEAGSFTNAWTAADVYDVFPNYSFSFFSTDILGTPSLDLTIPGIAKIVFSNPGGTWSFGIRDQTGPTNTYVTAEPGFGGGGGRAYHSSSAGFHVTGTVVPEPSVSILLLISTLATCSFRRDRKRNKN